MASSTCFENPSVHPQEDLYVQFYGISFMHPFNQSGRWQDVLDTIFDVISVHFVGSYYVDISNCTVQKT